MDFEWDEAKRSQNWEKHRIDFADADECFSSSRFEWRDERRDYGEEGHVAIGVIAGVFVCVSTPSAAHRPHYLLKEGEFARANTILAKSPRPTGTTSIDLRNRIWLT